MEFRSSNAGGYVHFGGDVVSGVNSTAGVMLSSNTVSPVSDSSDANLVLRGKGAGQIELGNSSNNVFISGSSTPFRPVFGLSTTAVPNMPANSQAISTMTCVGISTGDIVVSVSPRDGLSTGVTLSRSYAGTNEIINVWINPHASSIAAESEQTCRWFYIDRT
jgi:hypothetical protein